MSDRKRIYLTVGSGTALLLEELRAAMGLRREADVVERLVEGAAQELLRNRQKGAAEGKGQKGARK